MEFISAEEFLKQPAEVRKVFIDWWTLNINENDLCQIETHLTGLYPRIKIDIYKNNTSLTQIYPLFTEGQLRKFIEDKTGLKLDIENDFELNSISICLVEPLDFGMSKVHRAFHYLCNDLHMAYWQVACRVAAEVANEG